MAGATVLRYTISGRDMDHKGVCVDDLYLTTGMVNPLASGTPCGVVP